MKPVFRDWEEILKTEGISAEFPVKFNKNSDKFFYLKVKEG